MPPRTGPPAPPRARGGHRAAARAPGHTQGCSVGTHGCSVERIDLQPGRVWLRRRVHGAAGNEAGLLLAHVRRGVARGELHEEAGVRDEDDRVVRRVLDLRAHGHMLTTATPRVNLLWLY